mgnify:CR=1 FL=1
MQDNLVIVESPAKAKTIEKFLGKDFKVMSSYGHIRDLKKKELSIDLDTFEPCYEIPEEKKPLVTELRRSARDAKMVWLASDEDREGEAISWHLCEVLGLDEKQTNRIVFHEITKPAIVHAIETPRHLDMNLVNAQQARRVLDRLVGFGLSPVLWRKVKPSLSAGRVQSVALRLIVEREREVKAFKSEPFYRINALFTLTDAESKPVEVKAELNHRFATHDEALAFLEACRGARFRVSAVAKHPVKRSPAPPFTTSTLQQEAARKLGFSVSQTMMVAQRLYEAGNITYMRTDSVNLSSLAINTSKEEIVGIYGEDYSKPRQFHTHSKGAQEAHEAIRPTYMSNKTIEGTQQERRLYELVWKRTLASQMADAELEKTTVNIDILPATDEAQDCVEGHHFVAQGEVTIFDGFMKVYRESSDDESADHTTNILPPVKDGDELQRREITSTERFSLAPARYTEASLVRKMEELGIGRPSTYAPTISTIQQRQYVAKGEKEGTPREYRVLKLQGDTGEITKQINTEKTGSEKGKLVPTDIGIVVNDFLAENFPEIMDYNFTANVEKDFDAVADGEKNWTELIRHFYENFEPQVEKTLNQKTEHKVGERELGVDPVSGRLVSVKIGRFGPMVQMGVASDEEKPTFATLPPQFSLSSITLEEALELFKLPRTLGTFEDAPVVVNAGRFGPYVLHNKKYASLDKGEDPMSVTLERAVELILAKREAEAKSHLKSFEEEPDMEIKNGRYGPYIVFSGKNYKIPKAQAEKAAELTLEECRQIIEQEQKKPAKTTRKRTTTRAKKQ